MKKTVWNIAKFTAEFDIHTENDLSQLTQYCASDNGDGEYIEEFATETAAREALAENYCSTIEFDFTYDTLAVVTEYVLFETEVDTTECTEEELAEYYSELPETLNWRGREYVNCGGWWEVM